LSAGDVTGQSLPVLFSWFLCFPCFAEDLGKAIYKPIESTALFAVNQGLIPHQELRAQAAKLHR